MKTYHTFSSRETRTLGAVAAEKILAASRKDPKSGAIILSLQGDLGTGKTTFVQGFLRALGVKGRVASPTFVLVRRFRAGTLAKKAGIERAYHVDAYRLHSPHDAALLGLSGAFTDPRAVVLVEWPERLGKLVPGRGLKIRFGHGRSGKESRVIKASGGVLS